MSKIRLISKIYFIITLIFLFMFTIVRWNVVLNYSSGDMFMYLYIGWFIITMMYLSYLLYSYDDNNIDY